jgi:hypothetical protein
MVVLSAKRVVILSHPLCILPISKPHITHVCPEDGGSMFLRNDGFHVPSARCHNSRDRNVNTDQLHNSLNTSGTVDLPVMLMHIDACSLLRSARLIGNSVKESCLKKCSVNMFTCEFAYHSAPL